MSNLFLFSGCSESRAMQERSSNMKNVSYDGIFPQHNPLGEGVGVMPGRVVWNYKPASVNWTSGYWWENKNFDEPTIKLMIDESITSIGGGDNPKSSWENLFKYFNQQHGKGDVGYRAGERIAIKPNMNGHGWNGANDERTTESFITPILLKNFLLSLVEDGGVPAECITIYEVTRNLPNFMVELCTTGKLQSVKIEDTRTCKADFNSPIEWSKNFSGEKSYLPTCVTQADYLINFASLKGHTMNGVTLTAKNHFGSLVNSDRLAAPMTAGLHPFVTANGMNKYSVLVDLISNRQLGGKTLLYILDALIAFPSEIATSSANKGNTKWFSAPFNGGFTASIFMSQDPVAIDSVGTDFLMNEPTLQKYNSAIHNNPNVENYLHEATTAMSGIKYLDGNGQPIKNLGVHEHWNNSSEKKYSRNLGKSEGIELIQIF